VPVFGADIVVGVTLDGAVFAARAVPGSAVTAAADSPPIPVQRSIARREKACAVVEGVGVVAVDALVSAAG
jgi:ribosomal protein S12 methylthiotransferase accessory factor YcaO